MPHHPSIDGSSFRSPYDASVRVSSQLSGPPKLRADDGRSFFQSPPPLPSVPEGGDTFVQPPLPAPTNPRSQRAREKQRAVSPERNTAMSYEHAYGGMDVPVIVSKRTPSTEVNYSHSVSVQPQNEQLCYPQQDRNDPTFFHLPDVRKRTISAPLQPRITDLRTHIERDPTYSSPTFDVNISFKIKMEPGDLR